MKLALIGQDIKHSLSPKLQGLNAQACGKSINFDLIDVNLSEFKDFVDNKKWGAYQGLNVTTPYKEKAYQACDRLSPSAQCLKAVNTLKSEQGQLVGHNTDTDGVGFLVKNLISLPRYTNARIVILGVGGASRAAAHALSQLGAGHLLWISRDQKRALRCLAWCKTYFPESKATWLGQNGEMVGHTLDQRENTLLISGAPPLHQDVWEILALKYQEILGSHFGLAPEAALIDLNYGEQRTVGSRTYGLKHNLISYDGLSMLVGQGVSSFEWWTSLSLSPHHIYKQMLED
ncbi:MAG: hypothetical protein CMH49_04495 [Myxococcales bacterium]|nr:hypothetical protein [Myxococcales bacterium]